jgi:transposase
MTCCNDHKRCEIGEAYRTHGRSEILVAGTKWKRPLGKDSDRWEDDIKMYLEDVRLKGC